MQQHEHVTSYKRTARSIEYFEIYKHPNESKILRIFFGNRCKILDRRIESFFTINLKLNSGWQRTHSGANRDLLCSLPPGCRLSGSQKLGSWALGHYLTWGWLFLCIADQNQLKNTWNMLFLLFGNCWCLVCTATCPSDLQTLNKFVPQRGGMSTHHHHPLPVPCLCSKIWILEASSPLRWLLEAEWISWQENTQVSAWQTQVCWNNAWVLTELFGNQAVFVLFFYI